MTGNRERFTLDGAYLRDQIRRAVRAFFAPLVLGWRLTCVTFRAMDPDEDGWSEWVHPLPGYLLQCCDCDLIHEMEFAIVSRSDNAELNEGESDDAVIIFRARRAPVGTRPQGQDGEAGLVRSTSDAVPKAGAQ